MEEKYEELRKNLTKVGDIAMWISVGVSIISGILMFLFEFVTIGTILFISSQIGLFIAILFEQKTKDYLRELYQEYEYQERKRKFLKGRGVQNEI